MGKVVFFKDVSGQWRWRMIAGNGLTLAVSSEAYKNRQDCLEAWNTVRALPVDIVSSPADAGG